MCTCMLHEKWTCIPHFTQKSSGWTQSWEPRSLTFRAMSWLCLQEKKIKNKQIPHQFSNMPSQAKTREVKHGDTVGTIRSNWAVKWVQSKVPLDPWVCAERTVAQTRERRCFSLHAGGFKWMKKTVYNTENEKGCGQGTTAQRQWTQRGWINKTPGPSLSSNG